MNVRNKNFSGSFGCVEGLNSAVCSLSISAAMLPAALPPEPLQPAHLHPVALRTR